MSHAICSVEGKVVLRPGIDVLPDDLHKAVAVVRRLHVMEAKSVDELVDDCVEAEAATARNIWLEFDGLLATTAAN